MEARGWAGLVPFGFDITSALNDSMIPMGRTRLFSRRCPTHASDLLRYSVSRADEA